MNTEQDEILDRDTPGIFEMWESDVAELITNPASLPNLGACEPEQLAEMALDIEALAGHILGLYHQWYAGSTDLVWSKEVEVDGEIDDETLERGKSKMATHLTFDCRAWLKPELQEGGPANV